MSKVMSTPEQRICQRYAWFEDAARLGNVSLACKRLGISRKTFYKWRKRFQVAQGAKIALLDRSRPPPPAAAQGEEGAAATVAHPPAADPVGPRAPAGPPRGRGRAGRPERGHDREGRAAGRPHTAAPRPTEAGPPGLRRAAAWGSRPARREVGSLLGRGAAAVPVHGHRLPHAAPARVARRGDDGVHGQGLRPGRPGHLPVPGAVRPDGQRQHLHPLGPPPGRRRPWTARCRPTRSPAWSSRSGPGTGSSPPAPAAQWPGGARAPDGRHRFLQPLAVCHAARTPPGLRPLALALQSHPPPRVASRRRAGAGAAESARRVP